MDGFALRILSRARTGPYALRGRAFPSSTVSRRPLHPGEAIRVTTGAPLPPGTNAVVRSEAARPEGRQLVLTHAPDEGQDILEPGESIRAGEVILEAGQRIRPVDLALLLAQRIRRVPVIELRVTILPIGDELVPAGSAVRRGTPDHLGPLIAGIIGDGVTLRPPIPDDRSRVVRALLAASSSSDLVVTIGGSSVGERDVTKAALREVGEVLFDGVQTNVLKRGAVGLVGKTPVVVLPGQLVSAVAVHHEHGLHVLSRLVGRELREYETRRLAEEVVVHHRMDSLYLLERRGEGVAPLPWGVARMESLARASGFALFRRGRRYPAGCRVTLQRLWSDL